MSNEELYDHWVKGDERSLTKLFENNNKGLVRLLIYRTKCQIQDADDIVQEAWIKLLNYKEKFSSDHFFNFMAFISYRIFIDRKRKKSLDILPIYDSNYLLPEDNEQDRIDYEDLDKSVIRLFPIEQQEVVMLRVYRNLKFREITKVMKSKSIDTSLARYRYATQKLKKMML